MTSSGRCQLATNLVVSVRGRSGLQVYLLPFTLHDSLANLGGRLALLVQGIGVIGLFQANRTLSTMGALEAAAQALVSHAAVAIAIAGLLIHDIGNLGS